MQDSLNAKPLRTLHCIYMCEYGGIALRLLDLLRLGRTDVQFDLCVLHHGRLEQDFIAAGATIQKIPHHAPAYFRCPKELRKLIAKGNYDVVHFHLSNFSGHVMKIAADCGVPVRIAHSRTTSRAGDGIWCVDFLKNYYHKYVNLPLVKKYATHLLACSRAAGETMFGRIWNKVPSYVLLDGINLGCYKQQFDTRKRQEFCRKYDIPDDAIVVETLGRLTFPKNHEFLLRIFHELSTRNPRYVLFIGGDGKLRLDLERQIKELSLEERVFLPGACREVPELICQLFDVFCLPSHFEGLSNVLIEALTGGLHAVHSDVVPQEVPQHAPERFTALSLSDSIADWCDAIEEGIRRKQTPIEGVAIAEKTPFSTERSMNTLLEIYRGIRE